MDFKLDVINSCHSRHNTGKGNGTMNTSLPLLRCVLNLVEAPTENSRLLFPWQFRWVQPRSMSLDRGGHVQSRQTDEHCGQGKLTAWGLCWRWIREIKTQSKIVRLRERERRRERNIERETYNYFGTMSIRKKRGRAIQMKWNWNEMERSKKDKRAER